MWEIALPTPLRIDAPGDAKKFDRGLSRLLHTELHWLDVPAERVMYKLSVMMYICLQGPARLLPSSLWCHTRITAASPIRRSTTARCIASEAEYGICPTGFLCGWPVGVEFAAGLERSGSWQRHFLQKPKRRFCSRCTDICSALEIFTTMRYINLRLLTYLLTYGPWDDC